MPSYPFRCPECQAAAIVVRRMADHDQPHDCAECGRPMQREFHAQFQVVGQPFLLDDANKFALGFDETTRKEAQKADDALYQSRLKDVTPINRAPKSLAQTHYDLHGPMS